MNIQKQPHKAGCLITAYAMILDLPVEILESEVCHGDPSRIVDPMEKIFSDKVRGYCNDDIQLALFRLGYIASAFNRYIKLGYGNCTGMPQELVEKAGELAKTNSELEPIHKELKQLFDGSFVDLQEVDLFKIIDNIDKCILILMHDQNSGMSHAVAYEGGICYDPNFLTYPIERVKDRIYKVIVVKPFEVIAWQQ